LGMVGGLPSAPVPSVNCACVTRIAGYGPPTRDSRSGVLAEALADVSGCPPCPPPQAASTHDRTSRRPARRIRPSSRVPGRLSTKSEHPDYPRDPTRSFWYKPPAPDEPRSARTLEPDLSTTSLPPSPRGRSTTASPL